MVIEYQGKRYPVVGESDTHYICTEPLHEVEGETCDIPKKDSKIIKGLSRISLT